MMSNRLKTVLLLVVPILALHPCAAWAAKNAIVIESKTVLPGQDSVRVGIWLSNSSPVYILYLSLEVRAVSPGAFPARYIQLFSNPFGRVELSGLGAECAGYPFPWPNPTVDRLGEPDSNNWCSGPISNTYSRGGLDPSRVSPEAFWLAAVGICGAMPPGSDPEAPDSASIRFLLRMPYVAGRFEIDTCCMFGGHTRYDTTGSENTVSPDFAKGVITICDCRCQGDPACDSSLNVSDIVMTIDRAFQGLPRFGDEFCIGHLDGSVDGRTDIDCSGATDIVDVVRLIGIAFRGGAAIACDACK